MKNKKIIDAFDSILPNDDVKNRILSDILNNKKKNSFKLEKPLKSFLLAACLILSIFIFKINYNREAAPNEEVIPMNTYDLSYETFTYNDQKYVPTGITYTEADIKGKVLFIVDDINSNFYGAKVYEGKNKNIIIYFNNTFMEYEKLD